jgi:hypothetical protein
MGTQRATAIRYETLCSDPEAALAAVGRVSGLDFTHVRVAAGKPLDPMAHMIRGNPRLKAKETVHLAADHGFRSELTFGDRLAYAAASGVAPALRTRKRV